ncbi:MAG: protein phosphatase 2C domain-containing protein [Deltaproteobacteria bacterium]|nr:protein phosphatase 2C domain-containing protein [Deltaproteobacteria bacterium]
MLLESFAITTTGRRAQNEDAICARPDLGLFVVADGMGGYEGGEIASRVAVTTIEELVARTASDADVTWPYRIDPRRGVVENEVAVATRLANDRILRQRHGELAQMGSTVVVLRLAHDRAVLGHVGDSRIYRLRDGALAQLTVDHSLYALLVASGAEMPSKDEFALRHVITRALGTPNAEAEVQAIDLRAGDVFMLCSDGLSEVLEPALIAARLALPARSACELLVDEAYAAGSRDNISAVVVRVR